MQRDSFIFFLHFLLDFWLGQSRTSTHDCPFAFEEVLHVFDTFAHSCGWFCKRRRFSGLLLKFWLFWLFLLFHFNLFSFWQLLCSLLLFFHYGLCLMLGFFRLRWLLNSGLSRIFFSFLHLLRSILDSFFNFHLLYSWNMLSGLFSFFLSFFHNFF